MPNLRNLPQMAEIGVAGAPFGVREREVLGESSDEGRFGGALVGVVRRAFEHC